MGIEINRLRGGARPSSWLLLAGLWWLWVLHPAANAAALPQDTDLASEPAGIELNFSDNIELKGLIEYVSQRLGINILYDDQVTQKRLTIQAPTRVPESSLLGLLESALRMNGLALVEADQPGWKRVAPIAEMAQMARPMADGESAEGGKPMVVTRVFQLAHASPNRVEAVIKPFLTQPGANTVPVHEHRLLIVTDFRANIARVERLIRMVDQPVRRVVIEFVEARHRPAEALAQQVAKLMNAKLEVVLKSHLASQPLTEGLEITHDEQTNQVALVGVRDQVDEAIAMLKSLDTAMKLRTKVYRFGSVSPERVDRLARELIGSTEAGRLYQSVVDSEGGVLVVTATDAIHDQVQSLQADLDVPVSDQQNPIRVYKLVNTTATDVLETIRSLEASGQPIGQLGEGPGGGRLDGPAASTTGTIRLKSGTTEGPPGRSPKASPRSTPTPAPGRAAEGGRRNPETDDQKQKTDRASSDLAEGVTAIGGFSGEALVAADVNTNSLIVVGSPRVQQIYEGLIRILDRRRPQVLIEVTIVTLNTSDDYSLGVEIIGAGTAGDTRVLTFSQFGLSQFDPITQALTLLPGMGFNGAVLDTGAADVVIQALKEDSRAKVIAAPRILVNDNATGTLSSVEEQPTTSTTVTQGNPSQTSFGGFVEAGTTITVTPHISEGEHLSLEYSISLNSFTGDSASGDVPPPRQTDSIESEVTVPDGRTIIVGGLHRVDFTKQTDAVPVLGEIPVLKHLFSNETKKESDTTLFVFIRPIILRDDQFEDLKYLSEKQLGVAGLASDFPTSEPMVVE